MKYIYAVFLSLLLFLSCKKDDETNEVNIPSLSTFEITDITDNMAKSGGDINDDGGAEVTAKGVCWSTSPSPTLYDFATNEGSDPSNFISYLINLLPNTTYYLRAYATNSKGTGYGNELSFTTDITCLSGVNLNAQFVGPSPETITSIINITDDSEITDLFVKVSITHTFDADLDIFLISPNGIRIELSTDNGADESDYINTIFNDGADISILAGIPPFTGIYKPEDSLSQLYGLSMKGNWTLEVSDDLDGDDGKLLSWNISNCAF